MQDRFKFRVWLKELIKPRMTYTSGLSINKNQIDDSDNIIMQCTGVKDKNGELVYFDDFIKLDDGIICIVKQIDDINDIEYGKVIAIPVFCFNKKYPTRYIPTVISESEKVGNLYENPELLEQTKADPFEHC